MAVLDFKEIPEAHKASGLQDAFELFARDLLAIMGYQIIAEPNRGPDGGVDLIVEEKRSGVGGETIIRWLVSCKHKAFSGNAVSAVDDANIRDRVEANECQGFIGFYSTLASSGLSGNLGGMKSKFEYQIFDREKIEDQLLHSTRGLYIAERYFPISFSKWRMENPHPAEIFSDESSLRCKVCSKNLLEQDDKGIITLWHKLRTDYESESEYIEHIFWTCRGHCDRTLAHRIRSKQKNLIDGWEDISDVMMPTVFIKWIMVIMNQQRSGTKYSDEAYENLKVFILKIFPYISRHLTSKEKNRIQTLCVVPSYLGGLGYED